MIKTIKISINDLLEFIDQDKLVDWVRGQKEIREKIDEVSEKSGGNYYDGLASVRVLNNDVLIDFEIQED